MIRIKIEKKDLWLLSAIMVFLLEVAYVIAYNYINPILDPGHGGDKVFVRINGADKDLQQAINDNDFDNCALNGGSFSGAISDGHPGEQIIINVGGNIKSLQQAINDNSLSSVDPGTSPSVFGDVNYGNTGDEILINIGGSEKTLQQAIDDGDFTQRVMYVSISMSKYENNPMEVTIVATVTARLCDASGQRVQGALVYGRWQTSTGSPFNVGPLTTNSNGQVTFTTTDYKLVGQSMFFTVTSITVNGVSYDLVGETTDSIIIWP